MNNEEKKYWVAISHIDNIGPKKFKLLTTNFPSLKKAWQANYQQLKNIGLSNKDIQNIIAQRHGINPDQAWNKLNSYQINTICINEETYPKLLKEIYSPPPILYYQGVMPSDDWLNIAVVGTRKTSTYGRQITPEIVRDLSTAGLTIVSGLALGIDALAHQAALDANGPTIAVLGCGLDSIYPVSNTAIADKIICQGGCIISEYPPGTKPLKQHFPARNRIISGLAKGVVVIEGSHDSGSLITARCALEQNREIFAVPGNISNQNSQGPNNLIKMGACLVTDANDILSALNLENIQQYIENKKNIPANHNEEIIINHITGEPKHVDEIIQKCKLKTSIIISTLTIMEMKGMIRHIGGKQYIKNR